MLTESLLNPMLLVLQPFFLDLRLVSSVLTITEGNLELLNAKTSSNSEISDAMNKQYFYEFIKIILTLLNTLMAVHLPSEHSFRE